MSIHMTQVGVGVEINQQTSHVGKEGVGERAEGGIHKLRASDQISRPYSAYLYMIVSWN